MAPTGPVGVAPCRFRSAPRPRPRRRVRRPGVVNEGVRRRAREGGHRSTSRRPGPSSDRSPEVGPPPGAPAGPARHLDTRGARTRPEPAASCSVFNRLARGPRAPSSGAPAEPACGSRTSVPAAGRGIRPTIGSSARDPAFDGRDSSPWRTPRRIRVAPHCDRGSRGDAPPGSGCQRLQPRVDVPRVRVHDPARMRVAGDRGACNVTPTDSECSYMFVCFG